MRSFLLLAGLTAALATAQSSPSTAWPDAATTEAWLRDNPGSLPQWPTADELLRWNEVGRDFTLTDPPVGEVHGIAEFEPMQGVLIRYPFGLNMTTIAALAARTPLTTIVSGQSTENTVRNQYTAAGIDLSRCTFLHGPTQSYWTRDYGPWYIETSSGVSIVDFPYNRPRAGDDNIPVLMADWLDVDLYGMDVIHTGGNWMCDGVSVAASTTLVLEENPGLTPTQVDQRIGDYLGIGDYLTIPDPNNEYIDHIDCWGKFLDVDKVLVRSVPQSHPQYDEIEAAAAAFANSQSAWGTPFEIWRVNTPNNQPYTNSLILNDCVFVPITNSSYDAAALAVYAAAMPGYEILPCTGSWLSTDALHCRTRGIADTGMLSLRHTPLHGSLPSDGAVIEATIHAYSGSALIADSLAVYWRTLGDTWQRQALVPAGGDRYTALLPLAAQADTVEYYLSVADQSGRQRRQPRMGALDPHRFTVQPAVAPEPPQAHLEWNGAQLIVSWAVPEGAASVRVEWSDAPWGPWSPRAEVAAPGTSYGENVPGPLGFYRLRSVAP
jgi:agmatine deiminase